MISRMASMYPPILADPYRHTFDLINIVCLFPGILCRFSSLGSRDFSPAFP